MVEAAIGIVGSIVGACGLILEVRKLLKGANRSSYQEEMDKLFKEVKGTEGIMSHLEKWLRKQRHRDSGFEELTNGLNELKEILSETNELLDQVNKKPPSIKRRRKLKRLRKDMETKLSLLQISRENVMNHVEIDCLPSGDVNQASQQSHHHLIDPKDLSDIEYLCDGRWGPVKKAKLNGLTDVVIKYVKDIENHDLVENFQKEASVLVQFWYGCVVQLIGICDQTDEKFLVLEYMHKKSLDYLLHNCPDELLEPKRRVSMALDTAKAVAQVNALVLHTGIEAKRFLVDKDYNVKISDLRFAKTFSSCKRYKRSRVGTVTSMFYTCPERYEPAPYTEKSEVYRLGIVLWEILSRSKPFSTLSLADATAKGPSFDDVRAFVKANGKEQLPQDFGDPNRNSELNNLVQKCRDLDPGQRPTVKEVVQKLEDILDLMEEEDPSGED